MEEAQWNRFELTTEWVTDKNWTYLRDKCWKSTPLATSSQQKILKFILRDEREIIQIETIQRMVADFFGMTLQMLKGKKPLQENVFARHVAIYLSKELTTASLSVIGRRFNRDHATIIHAYKNIKKDLNMIPDYKK